MDTEHSREGSKELIATRVTGTVKWFNAKSGYGFIIRDDTKEDLFVHQTVIVKNNSKKAVRSVGDGERVEFDVVAGGRGAVASNVSAPGGSRVKGSPYVPDKKEGKKVKCDTPGHRARPELRRSGTSQLSEGLNPPKAAKYSQKKQPFLPVLHKTVTLHSSPNSAGTETTEEAELRSPVG